MKKTDKASIADTKELLKWIKYIVNESEYVGKMNGVNSGHVGLIEQLQVPAEGNPHGNEFRPQYRRKRLYCETGKLTHKQSGEIIVAGKFFTLSTCNCNCRSLAAGKTTSHFNTDCLCMKCAEYRLPESGPGRTRRHPQRQLELSRRRQTGQKRIGDPEVAVNIEITVREYLSRCEAFRDDRNNIGEESR